MAKVIKFFFVFSFLSFILFISGCNLNTSSKLNSFDKKIGDSIKKIREEDTSSFFSKEELDKDKSYARKESISVNDLSNKQKEKIDEWLKNNNLNRYGDQLSVIYAGGTPLFNEITGESIDRYSYILNNHTNLLNELDKIYE